MERGGGRLPRFKLDALREGDPAYTETILIVNNSKMPGRLEAPLPEASPAKVKVVLASLPDLTHPTLLEVLRFASALQFKDLKHES